MKYSRWQKSCNKQTEQWKTTIDLLCLNGKEGHAEVGKIIRFICSKSFMVFTVLQSAVQANDTHKRYCQLGTKTSFYVHTIKWAGELLIPLRMLIV